MRMMRKCSSLVVVLLFAAPILALQGADPEPAEAQGDTLLVPVVKGDWWRITDDDPDVSPFRIVQDSGSNTCDFTVYRDADETWHAIACVRGTSAPGQRVLHQWTSESLKAENWRPRGILDWPRGSNRQGEPAAIQAPHAFRHEGKYYCFYNSAGAARAMISDDGVHWSAFANIQGERSIFRMGRDVNLFHDLERGRWQATYTGAWPRGNKHAMVARTAPTLAGPWSDPPIPIKTEGNPESPFLLKRGQHYYLFQQMEVFLSDRPTHFEGAPLTHMTGIWYGGKWAPEVVTAGGQDYLAGYGGGLWIARMDWAEMTPAAAEAYARPILEKVRTGRAAEEERRRERERPQDSEG